MVGLHDYEGTDIDCTDELFENAPSNASHLQGPYIRRSSNCLVMYLMYFRTLPGLPLFELAPTAAGWKFIDVSITVCATRLRILHL